MDTMPKERGASSTDAIIKQSKIMGRKYRSGRKGYVAGALGESVAMFCMIFFIIRIHFYFAILTILLTLLAFNSYLYYRNFGHRIQLSLNRKPEDYPELYKKIKVFRKVLFILLLIWAILFALYLIFIEGF